MDPIRPFPLALKIIVIYDFDMSNTATHTRTATRKPTKTREERAAATAALAERLAEFAESCDPDDAEVYEERFSHYSPRNAMLIVMQAPDATVVHGFRAWQDLSRQVRKGETGIAILAPAGTSTDKDPGKAAEPTAAAGAEKAERRFFRMTYVFDIRQTDPIGQTT